MTLFYVALFFGCLTGVCALVLIGDKLRRVYVDWCETVGGSIHSEPAPHGHHGRIASLLMR